MESDTTAAVGGPAGQPAEGTDFVWCVLCERVSLDTDWPEHQPCPHCEGPHAGRFRWKALRRNRPWLPETPDLSVENDLRDPTG